EGVRLPGPLLRRRAAGQALTAKGEMTMNTTIRRNLPAAAAAAVLILSGPLPARIKLVALPDREAAIVRLDHPTFTLVEEERTLTLQKGENQIDFSWKGVSIDGDSIRLLVLGHPQEVKLLSVSYPPGEAALVWQVYAPRPLEEKARISYLLSGID